MQVHIHTDHNIEGHGALTNRVSGVVEDALSGFSDRITHVNVYLSDQNSDYKVGNDAIRCIIEAHIEGHQPLAVTHQDTTLNQAVDGAAEKLTHLIEHTLGRLEHQESHRTDPPLARSV